MIPALAPDTVYRLSGALPSGVTGRTLTSRDTEALAALRVDIVRSQLPDPNCYRLEAESPDFPASHLGLEGPGRKGVIAGMFDAEESLIAYGALTLPAPGEPHLGDALDLPPSQKVLVAYMASAMVRKEWRGHGLHHALIRFRMNLSSDLGRRHVVASTWPGNHQSWGHLVAHGLQCKRLVQVSSGLLRLVAHHDMAVPARLAREESRQLVPLADLASRGQLFGDGFWLWRRIIQDGQIYAEMAMPDLQKVAASG